MSSQPHSDMQWRRTNGSIGHYSGPLIDLGHGIPRRIPSYGIRAALFDLAFGYVSGFPVRDILTFSARSLFPQAGRVAFVEIDPEDARPTNLTAVISVDLAEYDQAIIDSARSKQS